MHKTKITPKMVQNYVAGILGRYICIHPSDQIVINFMRSLGTAIMSVTGNVVQAGCIASFHKSHIKSCSYFSGVTTEHCMMLYDRIGFHTTDQDVAVAAKMLDFEVIDLNDHREVVVIGTPGSPTSPTASFIVDGEEAAFVQVIYGTTCVVFSVTNCVKDRSSYKKFPTFEEGLAYAKATYGLNKI